MLPSRGIVRALPSGALQRQLASQSVSSRTLTRRFGHGRQIGATLTGATTRAGLTTPVVMMGGVATTRAFSLWPFGKKKVEEPTTATEAVVGAPEPPVETTTITAAQTAPEAVPSSIAEPAITNEALTPSSVLPSDIDLTSIAELGAHDILNMPENIGYLSALGLDYGWGPTSVMQWMLEHVHVYSGWGWAGSIVATALLLRAAMFYPQVRSLKFNAAMNLMRQDPRGKEAMELVKRGYQTNDREMMQKGQFMNKMVREEYGAATSGMLWSFMQIPFSFGLFRILNGMVHIPVPSMESAGWLWFSDLTASDPYFILPAVGSGLLFGAMMVNSKYAPAQQKAMMKKMMWVFGTVGFVGTTFLSAAVNLMMVATGSATLLTAIILNNPTVRRLVNLPILEVQEVKYEPPRPTVNSGVAGLRERLTNNLDDMKKGLTDQVSGYTGNYASSEQEKAEKKRRENLRKIEEMRKKLEVDEFEKKYKGGR